MLPINCSRTEDEKLVEEHDEKDAQERIGVQGGATTSLSRFTRGGIHGCELDNYSDEWL